MEYKLEHGTLRLDKVLSDLDKLVLDFVSVLVDSKIRYVIISGYVAIFFGRSRTTEDIDVFVEKMGRKKFNAFYANLIGNGYWVINAADEAEAFDLLMDSLAIRAAKKDNVVPNFEIKLPKKDTDFFSLDNAMKVVVNGKTLLMSPFEMQIPFKLWLGSEKDIEDAVHLYTLFNDRLDKRLMARVGSRLGVKGKMVEYGIK